MPVLTHADLRLNYQLIGPDPKAAPSLAATLRRRSPKLSPGSSLGSRAELRAEMLAERAAGNLPTDTLPVALIHGLGTNLAFWYLGAMRHLGRDRSFILHDLRGHGASSMPARGYSLDQMAEDFRLLLDRLGIARAHVVGHSHGARVALVFALTHPDRVESLTIADTQIRALQPPMPLGEWPYWKEWKADLIARGVKEFPPEDSIIDFRLLADLGPRSAGGKMLADTPVLTPGGGEGRAMMPTEGRRIDLQSRQMGARGADQWKALLETTTASDEMHDESMIPPEALPRLTMPVLLMYGEVSHCVPTSDRLMEAMPQARRILVPGAGHFFPIVKPRLFARALNVFLARVESAEPATRATSQMPMPVPVADHVAEAGNQTAGNQTAGNQTAGNQTGANQTDAPQTGLRRFAQMRRFGSGLVARAAGRQLLGGPRGGK